MKSCKYREFSLKWIGSKEQIKNTVFMCLAAFPICIRHRYLVQIGKNCLHDAILGLASAC